MNAKTLFDDKLPQMMQAAPHKAKELDAIFLFTVTGDSGGVWTINCKADKPSISSGDAGGAECTIEVEGPDFEAMLKDPQLAMQLYFQGKLKIGGNPMLATKLQQLFSMGGV
jgi:hypothetical protein